MFKGPDSGLDWS